MEREQIIRMAREAGIGIGAPPHEYSLKPYCPEYYLERFARAAYAAGAAAERERIIAANAPEIERINAYLKARGEK